MVCYVNSTSINIMCVLSHFWLFATVWTTVLQALLFIECSQQEYCSELPFPSPRYLPNRGIECVSPASPALQADFLPLNHWGSPSINIYLFKRKEWIFTTEGDSIPVENAWPRLLEGEYFTAMLLLDLFGTKRTIDYTDWTY